MHRLFVAIRPPREVRERLLALMEGVPGARWESEDQLHLTLRFIGELDTHRAEDVAAALRSLHAPRFALRLRGAGRFEKRGRANSLWIGLAPSAELAALHLKVEAAVVRAGLPPESRAFHPHVTLARFPRAGGISVDAFLAAAVATASPPFAVESFGLYESRLGNAGASYELAERYALG